MKYCKNPQKLLSQTSFLFWRHKQSLIFYDYVLFCFYLLWFFYVHSFHILSYFNFLLRCWYGSQGYERKAILQYRTANRIAQHQQSFIFNIWWRQSVQYSIQFLNYISSSFSLVLEINDCFDIMSNESVS